MSLVRSRTAVVLVLVALVFVAPTRAETAPVAAKREYSLRLHETHTGERIDIVYRRGDQYIPEALAQLDHFLRDHRTGDVHHFDPRLYDLLSDLTAAVGRQGDESKSFAGIALRGATSFCARGPRALPSTACTCKPKPSISGCRARIRWICAKRPFRFVAVALATIPIRISFTSIPAG